MSVFSIAGKRVILARGIGASVSLVLVRAGANVAVLDILDKPDQDTAQQSTLGEGSIFYKNVDISNRDGVFASVQESVKKLKGLDSIISCAVINRPTALEDLAEADLALTMDINMKGTVYLAQAAFKYLKERRGTIVNFGSDGGLHPAPGMSAYAAPEGAIHSVTRNMALEWGRYGIRANAILPLVITPMFEAFLATLSPDEKEAWIKDTEAKIPLKSPGRGLLEDCDKDLSPVVQVLVSDASQYITGQLIPVNGGNGHTR